MSLINIRQLLLIVLVIISVSCKGDRKKSLVIKKNGITMRGDAINDSTFDGNVFYYNYDNKLIQKSFYKNGKEDGISIEYNLNGKPVKTTSYCNGLKNGYNSYYDSLGGCSYRDFYYYNLIVGPIIYNDSHGNPRRFFFVNLQNETLVDLNYEKWVGIDKIVSSCINYISNGQKTDSVKEISLLLYLIDPPKFSFDYSIIIKQKFKNDVSVIISKIEKELPFKEFTLPVLTNGNQYYSIRLNIYDSILNKNTVIDKEIW